MLLKIPKFTRISIHLTHPAVVLRCNVAMQISNLVNYYNVVNNTPISQDSSLPADARGGAPQCGHANFQFCKLI
jgi:hypothetical protein